MYKYKLIYAHTGTIMVPDLAHADKSGSFPIVVPEVTDELPRLYNAMLM